MLYDVGDSQHTQNIQVKEVIGGNEKCVFYFKEKKPNRLFGQPNTTLILPPYANRKICITRFYQQ